VRVCALDGVPIALHVACWRCGALFGPAHEERAPDALRLGLCRSCWRSYGRWVRGVGAEEDRAARDAPRPRGAPDRGLTVAEVAARLNLHSTTVRKMIRAGTLRSSPVGGASARGRRHRVGEDDLARYVQARAGLHSASLSATPRDAS
jgi:excisionase family DNA binding protein